MPLYGLSVCPGLWDKADRDQIDTKEELKDKCTIKESILKRDLWKESGQLNPAGLSFADSSHCGREATVLSREVSVISDYGRDLLCYRLFYLSAASDSGIETTGLIVAEDSGRLVRCRGMPDDFGLKEKIGSGYGIEICHFRMKQGGFCLMKDFERLEGISENLETSLHFFQQLVEGRVYPCSLADLCEDYSEIF